MSPAVLDQTTISIQTGDYMFRATGSVMKFAGFTALYEETKEDNGEDEDGAARLPEVNEGESLKLEEFHPEQHFTKPPPRYSEASLIRALEENGIGRPSTYAPTVNTIVDRGYVLREKGRLQPAPIGEKVNELLVANFPDILDIAFTARLEEDLDHVEEGRREWRELLRVFYTDFERDLTAAEQRMVAEALGDNPVCPKCGGKMDLRQGFFGPYMRCKDEANCDGRVSLRRKAQAEPTDEKCDKCGSPMVIREGRFGRFMACSAYPKCKNTFNVDDEGQKLAAEEREAPVKTDQKCPDCGSFLLIRKTRRGGEPFYGCEKYPKCKFTKPMELGLACLKPGCEGQLVTKRGRGRRFIGCDQYPKCDFTAFGELDRETPCPKCGQPWTTVSRPKDKPHVRRCPKPGCGYEEELLDAITSDDETL